MQALSGEERPAGVRAPNSQHKYPSDTAPARSQPPLAAPANNTLPCPAQPSPATHCQRTLRQEAELDEVSRHAGVVFVHSVHHGVNQHLQAGVARGEGQGKLVSGQGPGQG